MNKLKIFGGMGMDEGKKYALRLDDEMAQWIEDNTTGSQNSVLNYLIHIGIEAVEEKLKLDSVYDSINDE